MPDSMIRIVPIVLCAITASAMTTNATEIPQRWALEDVTHPDVSLSISALNENGDISGTATHYDWEEELTVRRPYIWQDGVAQLIEAPSYVTRAYELNDACLGMAIDHISDHVYHYTTDGMTDLGYLGDLFGGNMYMRGINSSGQFTGYRPLGSSIYNAFTWDEKRGLVYIAPDQVISYAFDINEAGAVVGYAYTSNVTSPTAYLYHDGTRTDFGSSWPGSTYAYAIDDAGRILLRQYLNGTVSYHLVDSTDYSSTHIASFGTGQVNVSAKMNHSGQAAVSWILQAENGELLEGNLSWWTSEDGLIPLEVPAGSIGITIHKISESGWILASSHDVDYNNLTFVTSANNELFILNDRMIGLDSVWNVVPVDMNEAGQIAAHLFFWDGDAKTLRLSPARPGDVDGDGNVGVNDLLAVISAWGDWPVGGVCGPDLNMDGSVNVNDLLAVISDWH